MARCNYEVVEENNEAIYIVDQNLGNMSVTNDAESVCIELTSRYGLDKRIIYRDSEGNWDEMIHRKGEFVRFAPVISNKDFSGFTKKLLTVN